MPTPSRIIADRLRRPQRVGVLGGRAVGKTTLLAMLYREGAGGRLSGLRLASADAVTATYLGDRVRMLEAGESPPATLDRTPLRFTLYRGESRLELELLDYQGEHVALGRDEAARDFIRDCDAVFICLPAGLTADEAADRLRAEQEVEQAVEDYLALRADGEGHRPTALLVTKADLLTDAKAVGAVQVLVDQHLAMTRHAMTTHAADQGVFPVSALGPVGTSAAGVPMPLSPEPTGLAEPLAWLADALRRQDTSRVERLFAATPVDVAALADAVKAYSRRYPDAEAAVAFRRRVVSLKRTRLNRRVLTVAASLLALVGLAWVYDAYGAAQLASRLESSDDAVAKRRAVAEYDAFFPTRHVFRRNEADAHAAMTADLDADVRRAEAAAKFAEIRRRAAEPEGDVERAWAEFVALRGEYPEYDAGSEGDELRESLSRAAAVKRDARGEAGLRELLAAEAKLAPLALIDLAEKLSREHSGTSSATEIDRRLGAYLARSDERDYEHARDYSARNPTHFVTRRQKYQDYLDRRPRGEHASKARAALEAIPREWEAHDYRHLREAFVAKPNDLDAHKSRCRTYLAAHGDGARRGAVKNLLSWCEKVGEENEYEVTLVSGSFAKSAAATVSRGVTLSVTLEVGGTRYGPGPIAPRGYEPEWNHTFPRKVKWKMGDAVRVIVTDHYFWRRTVGDINFDSNEPSMRFLTGEIELRHGTLKFKSDFAMPELPKD